LARGSGENNFSPGIATHIKRQQSDAMFGNQPFGASNVRMADAWASG
jgi:hypothetical protein